MRKLPIGIQDFEYLRTNNFVYVDKTQYVYQLAHYGKPYFLGRPRRFGKSLFLSTLKAYFEGNKELFEGLKIAELEKEWVKYPVIYLDFNVDGYLNIDFFNQALNTNLSTHEEKWGKVENEITPASRLRGLIRRAYEKTGQRAVVLIDEYDKPLISTMETPALNEEIRTMLKGFYGVLKAEDANLRFVFLTGVTKFSQVSVFSDLNQLKDISLSEQYAEICGITVQELKDNFGIELLQIAEKQNLSYEQILEEMKKRYDGYHFSTNPEGLYNPFSVLNTLNDFTFRYYWFATGTPTFLVQHLANTGFEIPILENSITIAANSLMDYRAENEDYIPLLYQSGYLTIKNYDRELDEYTLGFPNEEVKYGFLNELLPQFPKKC